MSNRTKKLALGAFLIVIAIGMMVLWGKMNEPVVIDEIHFGDETNV